MIWYDTAPNVRFIEWRLPLDMKHPSSSLNPDVYLLPFSKYNGALAILFFLLKTDEFALYQPKTDDYLPSDRQFFPDPCYETGFSLSVKLTTIALLALMRFSGVIIISSPH